MRVAPETVARVPLSCLPRISEGVASRKPVSDADMAVGKLSSVAWSSAAAQLRALKG